MQFTTVGEGEGGSSWPVLEVSYKGLTSFGPEEKGLLFMGKNRNLDESQAKKNFSSSKFTRDFWLQFI